MSDRISRRWVEYIADFVNAGPLWDHSDGNSSGKEGSKLAPRQNPPSSSGDLVPSLYPDGPSAITQAEDAFTYREEMRQLALDVADANAEWRTLATTRACLERGGVQRAHLLFSYRQRKETDQIAAQITDIQGQLKGIQEQN
ncbi:hypothetical protein KXV78_006925, partial [Aspergillus fumigatus]